MPNANPASPHKEAANAVLKGMCVRVCVCGCFVQLILTLWRLGVRFVRMGHVLCCWVMVHPFVIAGLCHELSSGVVSLARILATRRCLTRVDKTRFVVNSYVEG
jgi:hypothetical protein